MWSHKSIRLEDFCGGLHLTGVPASILGLPRQTWIKPALDYHGAAIIIMA